MYTIETLLHDIIGYHYVASQTVTRIRDGGTRGTLFRNESITDINYTELLTAFYHYIIYMLI